MQSNVRARTSVDAALAALIQLVIEEPWTALSAAERLRERVADDRILRRARARVGRALADRTSAIGERAAATLDAALAFGPSWPSPSRTRPDLAPEPTGGGTS